MELKEGYKQTEVGVIPSDWEVFPLEAFTSFISYGFTNPMPTSESGVHMITAKDINSGKIQFDTARCTTEEAYRTLLTAKSRPKKGDLLLTKDGTLGRIALVGDRTVCINQSVAVLRPNKKAIPEFLKVLLEAPAYQNRMLEDAGGSTIKHIYITIVNRMPLVVPPTKAEQTAIATALSDADALIQSLEKLIVKKRNIKQGAMQELLKPKEGWLVKKLGEIAEIKTGKKDVNEGNPNGVYPFFTCSREPTYSDSYSFEGEAILIAGNGEVGNLHYFNGKFEAYQRTYVLQKFTMNTKYLWCQLLSFFKKSLGIGTIGSSIPYIKRENISDFTFFAPEDGAEQARIATILSDMDAEIAALETKLAKYKQIKQGMMQELLTGRIRLV